MDSAVILFAHGARDPQWRQPFEAMRLSVAERLAGVRVELAFLELMEPTLEDAMARLAGEGVTRVTLVPLFLAPGGHLRHDLPALLKALSARYPRVSVRVAPALGEAEGLRAAIAEWVCAQHFRS
ncbi:MAG: cobalamin biosynthesis protein CbiX [Azospira oryzae]|uniref:Cobalamin biosynthesis protein CbiX n=1 Tax=Pelomicrobium methylotrophicum TaxID=2602750 RepID=A0A5C7ETX6_9PROT|nr:CbiX/SirB N-terminal domain-containing protein [Pelomicrobium methylotrophicum]PZP61499.1 MAG: cobalamin biosynthesis protein CbiX [Azospira oryzae]PZP81120.1 MAG: cobalamin biosynthesis protein CbiX [Azospira oryzae]TXF11444.1 cobalamin biosynthesis protein CbiX [Pelomicrobium methylotrophicum]